MRFYDRTEELQDLREVMRQSFHDHSRLIVLTGRRRIGKTSLGLEAYEVKRQRKKYFPGTIGKQGSRDAKTSLQGEGYPNGLLVVGGYVRKEISGFPHFTCHPPSRSNKCQ